MYFFTVDGATELEMSWAACSWSRDTDAGVGFRDPVTLKGCWLV